MLGVELGAADAAVCESSLLLQVAPIKLISLPD